MLKVVWNIIKKLFSVVFYVLSPLKRLMCRRKRRTSDTILPLTNHYPSVENLSSAPNGTSQVTEFEPWDNWDGGDHSAQTRAAANHGSRFKMPEPDPEPEPEPDYFGDMTPVVKKTAKILVKKKEDINTTAISSKLAVGSSVPYMQSSELEAWEDTQTWEDEAAEDLSWEADATIKATKQAERQKRHLQQQRKKMERDAMRNTRKDGQFTAVKLS